MVCKAIARCWITGKVSTLSKISFGVRNTEVDEALSDLKYSCTPGPKAQAGPTEPSRPEEHTLKQPSLQITPTSFAFPAHPHPPSQACSGVVYIHGEWGSKQFLSRAF